MTQTATIRPTFELTRIDAAGATTVGAKFWRENDQRGQAYQASLGDHAARYVVTRVIRDEHGMMSTPVACYVAGEERDPSIGAMPAPAADAEPVVPDLGMFTPAGNAVIAKVVDSLASRSGRTMSCVVTALDLVADLFPQHKEAGDTAVREAVVAALAARDFIVRD